MVSNLTVEKNIIINADKLSVWDALTNPELTKQYFLNCEALSDWKIGSPIIYKVNSKGKEIIPVKGLILRTASPNPLGLN